MNIRRRCVEILQRILEEKIFFNGLKAEIEEKNLPFANMLILTALRHLVTLKQILHKFLNKKIPDKNKKVYYALLLGATEILYMDTPDYAAINEYVNIARKVSDKYTAGMVNAVLRRVAADKDNLNTAFGNNIFPEAFKQILQKDYSAVEIVRLEESAKAEPALDISVKNNPEELVLKLNGVLFANGTIRLKELKSKVSELYGFKEGLWWVQDLAASMPVNLLGDVKNKKALDLCAAPGGKTAQLLSKGAKVTAVDIDEERMARLRQNIKRLQLEQNLTAITADGLEFLQNSSEHFDIIVLDAPCSATGTFRRHPEVLHLKTADDVNKQLDIQAQMLNAAAAKLAPDGIILYCTCSAAKAEGENQITKFLQSHADFKLRAFDLRDVNKFNGKMFDAEIIDKGVLRTLSYYMQNDGGMDVFFAACLQKSA